MIRLTRLDGSTVWVREDAVVRIARSLLAEGSGKSEVTLISGTIFEVKETPEQVLRALGIGSEGR